ncbi:MAG: phosphate signaling complex protein PhoU [Gloeomargarita sp. SKYBB_i_bin120]|nr:phosphate signaling complex protein PhoU [Gloeomargarita sp. SKYG98]MCS7293134.1 phosphate signaling complex protein PhoU [Gloeomargarita sp. SKYB120]MDW8178699.1 phosphate signaling complex protein PhoU [Gloeomargarita sp. SKYBB_i_bin120]
MTSGPSSPEHLPFRRQVRHLEQNVLRMGALVEHSFRLCHQALMGRNLAAAEEIPLLDQQIDRFYRQIEVDCLRMMATAPPLAQDMRMLGAFMQLVRDLERIGDYAEDLGEIAIRLFPYPVHGCMADIQQMSHQAQRMLATSLVALADLDATVGQQVKEMDEVVDQLYTKVYQQLAETSLAELANQSPPPARLEPYLLLALVIRHLERMADHATNIGQRVAFIITGQR